MVIADNIFSGSFRDNIGGAGNGWGAGTGENSDMARNIMNGGQQDDGIECEGDNVNVRIYGNTVVSDTGTTGSGFGLAGTQIGPLYVFRNTYKGTAGLVAVKQGNTSPGTALFIHNTFTVKTGPAGTADGFSDIGGPTLSEGHTYLNNIIETDRYGIYRGGRTNRYDYNLWNPANWLVDEWNGNGSYQTLIQFGWPPGRNSMGCKALPVLKQTHFLYCQTVLPLTVCADSQF